MKPNLQKSPAVPAGERIYAIGDVHGCLPQLRQLVAQIEKDIRQYPAQKGILIFLGDYVDRGPFTKEVIEFLLHDLPASLTTVFLRGNHEDMLLRFLKGDPSVGEGWLQYGGLTTLMSYGVSMPGGVTGRNINEAKDIVFQAIPSTHLKFLADTKLYVTFGDYCFVHAGIKPNVAIDAQMRDDFLWIRKEFLASQADHGKVIVHGHSISTEPDIQPNRIGIDTGAYATGRLTCLILHEDRQDIIHT